MLAAASTLAIAPLILTLLPIIKVVAPLLISSASAWLYYRADRYAKAKTDNEVIPAALSQFFDAVTKAVLVVQQTFVDDIIEKSGDGALTESEKRQALAKAGALVMQLLPPPIEEVLRAYYGQRFQGVIEAEIEASVMKIKPYVSKALIDKAKRGDILAELRDHAIAAGKDKAIGALEDVAKRK